MTRKELAAVLARKTGKSHADADRAIAGFIEVISGTLMKRESVILVGSALFP